ncbi:16S rRNA (cytosine(1402)-N(4))-methyltransferase RsmH [Methylomarinum vadi]|uniref:16S rRNA (cytosine(1402)-N(4))-methyltransferase RsmH n=1 Tax=Methylomarinum vadi TaxID=438855 RepID=UPI0004DEFF5B|nr:16S rRNA (cytosine(1402)-N(4))-methyltransferase RsmH [Methylomarinum vadi]
MEHLPVLFEEALHFLKIEADGWYLDCTFGRGGHSRGILQQLDESGRLLAIDRDVEAIESVNAQELQKDKRFVLYHGRFSELTKAVELYDAVGKVRGVLMDLGVSSPQLDTADRGFSFLQDGPLDMRMDGSAGMTAAQWLAEVEENELSKVLFEYGEERFARKIARTIVERRQREALRTTLQLARLIEDVIPYREKHKHPATRTFQAIRIALNQELQEIEEGLEQAVQVLAPGGRLVVISFHSLEDRIVKRFIRAESGRKFNPGRLPVLERDIEQGRLKTIDKAIRAGQEELRRNPRARSAVMRVAEKR